MSAPSTTARQTPTGLRLTDGFPTKIAFAADPDVSFWEMTVKPPGLDGGDAVNTTTMHNVTWRTMAPRQLVTLTDSSTTVAYDPDLYNQILALLNVVTSITVHFPDGSTLDFFGFLRKFEAQELKEGEMPQATVDIVPTNYDPVAGTEQAPVLTSAAGT